MSFVYIYFMHYLRFIFIFSKLPFKSLRGFLHGFSQKSNEDEFSWKSNGGWRPLEQIQKTQGGRKNIIFLVFFLWVLYGFSHKSNEDEFSRIRTITYVSIL